MHRWNESFQGSLACLQTSWISSVVVNHDVIPLRFLFLKVRFNVHSIVCVLNTGIQIHGVIHVRSVHYWHVAVINGSVLS